MRERLKAEADRLLAELEEEALTRRTQDDAKYRRLREIEDILHGTVRCPVCDWPLAKGETHNHA